MANCSNSANWWPNILSSTSVLSLTYFCQCSPFQIAKYRKARYLYSSTVGWCDLASEGAKVSLLSYWLSFYTLMFSSMILLTTWSLSELCKSHLSSEREDYDPVKSNPASNWTSMRAYRGNGWISFGWMTWYVSGALQKTWSLSFS